MSAMSSHITDVSLVCLTVCSGADQRKHQSSTSLAFVRGIHRWPVDAEIVWLWWRHHELLSSDWSQILRNASNEILNTHKLPWWRHQMETFSALLALWVGQWSRALMFSLVCAWINGWVNNREAGDLRHHRAQYDVTVIQLIHNAMINTL